MRLTFDIDNETHEVLCRYIPHGLRKHTYRALIKGFALKLKENHAGTLFALLGCRLDSKELIESAIKDGLKNNPDQLTLSLGGGTS